MLDFNKYSNTKYLFPYATYNVYKEIKEARMKFPHYICQGTRTQDIKQDVVEILQEHDCENIKCALRHIQQKAL